MKKIFLTFAVSLMAIAPLSAKTASQLRVYINPGHGSWGANDRPMSLIGHANYSTNGVVDTLRFFETNTNLQKGFGMLEELIKYGLTFDRTKNQNNSYAYKLGAAMDMSNNIVMSRVKNGPSDKYPGSSNSYNKDLSVIQAEARSNNFDYFISIHSNASGNPQDDGEYRETYNTPVILYRGYDDPNTSASGVTTTFMKQSRDMALRANQYLLRDVHQNFSKTSLYTKGDISFYGSSSENSYGYRGYLGALKHGVPGYLSEGYFHTYSPSRHRAMNWEVDHVEGWYYANALADYFGLSKPAKGWIYGIIRDKTKTMNYKQYYARSGTNDVYHPINGCTVVLKKDGVTLQKKVTDNYYNGAFVFKDLAPGTYTLEYYHANYVTKQETVTVTANNITYPTVFLTPGNGQQYEETPLPSGFSEKYSFRHRYVNVQIPELTGKTIRRVVVYSYYMYILALDASNNPTILLYHPDTRKVIANVSTAGMDGTQLKCSDIQVTSDGVLLACNKELTQCDDEHVQAGDLRRGTFRIYRWNMNQYSIPEGNPYTWLTSQYTGDWYRSYAGDTFAWSGSSTDGMAVFSCETTGSSRGIRTMVIPVSNGVMGAESYHQPYYQGEAAKFSVTNFGDGYRFITSPNNANNYLVMGPGSNPTVECAFKHVNKEDVLGTLNSRAYGAGVNGGSAFSFGDHKLIATPVRSGNNVNGIRVTDISKGIIAAENATLTGSEFANITAGSWYVAGRQLWKENSSTGAYGSFLDIFLLRDDKICYLTTAPDTTDPVPVFTEKWCLSDAYGTTQWAGWDATQVRNMDYYQGKLYLVYQQKYIKVVNAYTCADLGNLNKAWVYGGTVKLADVKICDGKIVASNIALAANGDALRLYRWDNDNALPEVILETRDFGGAVRAGDYIGWSGTWTSGAFYFCSDDGTTTRMLRYDVTNGKVNPTPVVTKITTDGTTQLKTSISARVTPDNGGFWIDGRSNNTTYVNANGVKMFEVAQSTPMGNTLRCFSYQGSSYAIHTEYASNDLIKGFMRLICTDKGWNDTYWVADYPYGGLSASRTNGNGTSGLALYTHDNTIEIWLLITNQGIAHYVNREGTQASFNVSPVNTVKPCITPSRNSGNISAKVGEPASLPISFSGAYLCDDIHLRVVGDDAPLFSLSTDKVSINSPCETVYVSINSLTSGNYSAQIEATTEDGEALLIPITSQVTENIDFNDRIGALKDTWGYSENAGNLAEATTWFNTYDRPVRDLCIANHRLYVLDASPWNPNPEIHIIGAYSGVYNGKVSLTGVNGGETIAASLGELGGHLLLSNGARAAGVNGSTVSDPLKVYRWVSDSSNPVLWLQDNTHGGIQCGERMSVHGDMTNGKLLFSDGSKVLVYTVTRGIVSQTPQVITLTLGGAPCTVGTAKGSVEVDMMDDGSMWVTGNGAYPTHFDAQGRYIEEFTGQAVFGTHHGTSSTFFSFGTRKYLATAVYLNTTSQALPMTEGAMAIVDYTDGVANASTTTINPPAGLGTINNEQYVSKVMIEKSTDGERLNLWVMVPFQGISFYKFNAADPYSDVEDVATDATDGETLYFNLQGVAVARTQGGETPASLAPGIYIRVCGKHAEKVVIRP